MGIFQQSLDHLATKTELELIRGELATIRAEVSAAKLEYAELADKTLHMLQRAGKRLRDLRNEEEPQPTQPPQPEVDEVTARVLARRRAAKHGIPA